MLGFSGLGQGIGAALCGQILGSLAGCCRFIRRVFSLLSRMFSLGHSVIQTLHRCSLFGFFPGGLGFFGCGLGFGECRSGFAQLGGGFGGFEHVGAGVGLCLCARRVGVLLGFSGLGQLVGGFARRFCFVEFV